MRSYRTKTDFYSFSRFFSKLKIHITHFQLRNLVCCGPNLHNGIFYPLNYFHDHNLQMVSQATSTLDEYHSFFKINRLMPDNTLLERPAMKLDCLVDSRNLLRNSNSRISTLASSNRLLASGTFEGGYILQDISDPDNSRLLGEFSLTSNADGITNHIVINEDRELIVSSNDFSLRFIDLQKNAREMLSLPFAVNCLAKSPHNSNELLVTGDHVHSFILDKRVPMDPNFEAVQTFTGHEDFGFSCDWSSANANLIVTGNQDSCVKLWDRRVQHKSLYTWSSSLGSLDAQTSADSLLHGGPVRNTKFSHNGEYICWAESLDHIGIVQLDDLERATEETVPRVQSIDFIGKCIGLSFAETESGHGEELIVGVNDCPLGGILSYKLESRQKSLDFDFVF